MLKKSSFAKQIARKVVGTLSPKLLASIYNHSATGKWVNWKNPQDLNEKILWLSLCTDTTAWTDLADKYKVRDFIESKGYGHLLTKLYGVWANADDIDYDKLPSKFVLKTNHGSGTNIIVKDKSKLNIKDANRQLNEWLKMKFGWPVEPHYLRIKPLIIAEELLEDQENTFSSSLIDYKIFILNNEPEHIWACYNRTKNSVYVETHGLDWTYYPEKSVFSDQYRDGGGKIEKPKNLELMLKVAKDLSAGFPEVRVDFYEVNGALYFGEMTFSSNQGTMTFFTPEYLKEMGAKVPLAKT